jgi:hypothetical protein
VLRLKALYVWEEEIQRNGKFKDFHALDSHGCFNRVGGENGQCSTTKHCGMQEEVDMLTKECILLIRHKANASPRCCELVRASHAQCVCPKATLTESMILEH